MFSLLLRESEKLGSIYKFKLFFEIMGFLLGLKQSWHRSKVLSGFLLNLFEIELLMVLSLS